MRFSANTAQAQAQIAKLTQQMRALQAQNAAYNAAATRVMNAGLPGRIGLGSGQIMDFNIRGQARQMDDLTKRIQKGKITWKEYHQSVLGTNKLMSYQNALQKASLATMRQMGNGMIGTQLAIPALDKTNKLLRRNAVEWATAAAAARAYGRQVMDTGKNMAFMGRQALLSVTGPAALLAGGAAVQFYQIDKELTALTKVYGDSSSEMVASTEDVRGAAMGLAKEMNRLYVVGAEDTLKLASSFAALGESGKNLDYMVSAAARLIKLGDVSTESATKLISTLRTVFKLEGQELQDVINMANTFESQTTLTMQDFSDALPKMGAIVNSWGGGMMEAATILEGFTRNGINAVEGANALKSGFTKLVRPTGKLEDKFAELTGQFNDQELSLTKIVENYDGNVPKILARMGELQKAWDPNKVKSFQAELWGAYQLNRGMALTDALANPTDQMKKLLEMTEEEFRNYNETVANRELAIMRQSASSQFKQVINDIKIAASELGEKILPMITGSLRFLLNTVTTMVDGLNNIMDALGPLGGALKLVGKLAFMGAIAFGPLLLAMSSFMLIAGGVMKVFGLLVGGLARMRGNAKGMRGLSMFQTGAQKAAELSTQRINALQSQQGASTAALTTAINNLGAAYTRMTAASANAANQARRTAMAQASSARITNAAAQGMFGTLTTRQLNTARMGGMVLPNSMNNFNSINSGTKANPKSGNYLTPQSPSMLAMGAVNSPQWRAQENNARQAVIASARASGTTWANTFSAAANKAVKKGVPVATNQGRSFVSPAVTGNSTIAGIAREQTRRQAAGIGLMNQTAMRQVQEQYKTQAVATKNARAEAQKLAETQARNNAQIQRANVMWTENGQRIAGAAAMAGMLGTMLGGTNQVVQGLSTGLMIAATTLMIFPGLAGKAGAGITKMRLGMQGMSKMGPIFTKMFAGIGLAASKAFLPLAVAAVAAGAIYVGYRWATAGARKLFEQNEKIKNSAEGYSEILGYTRTQFGEIVNEAGEVEKTLESLGNELMANENTRPVIERMNANARDMMAVRGELEREAVKLFADGANADQVKRTIEAMIEKTNIDPIRKQELILEFENVTAQGLNGTKLSDAVANQISKVFGSTENNVASALQQMFGGKDAGDLSQVAKMQLDNIVTQLEAEYFSADVAQRGQVLRPYFDAIREQLEAQINQLDKDAQDFINSKGGLLNLEDNDFGELGQMGVDLDQVNMLRYQSRAVEETLLRLRNRLGDVGDMEFMFDDLTSGMAYFAQATDATLYGFDKGAENYRQAVERMGDAWDKLSDAQKISMLNAYRQASGQSALSDELAMAAIKAGEFGEKNDQVRTSADRARKAAEEESAELEDLADKFGTGRTVDWGIIVSIELEGGGKFALSAEDLVNNAKDTMSGVMDDYMEEMAAEAQIRWDAEKRAFEQSQQAATDALKERQDAEKKAMDERQEAEKDALDKSIDAEKKAFEKGWDQRLKDEEAAYDARIKAIEDTQEAEDDLERQRKRNAEREERRLRRLQQLMQTGIDINIALAGGDLEEVSRLSLNAAVNEQDFQTDWNEAEAGYAKEDADIARSKEIERIEEEKEARLSMLEEQREMEQEAMEARVEMRRQELERKHQMDQDFLSRQQTEQQNALTRQQEMENIAYEISFQANQRSLNRELEALRTQIPLNEAELYAHMQRVGGAYDQHGVALMDKGDHWSRVIEDSLITRMDNARKQMSNEQQWRDYGNRVAQGITDGAFNMSVDEFNRFLRTGEIPDAPKKPGAVGQQYGPFLDQMSGRAYHSGGDIGNPRDSRRTGKSRGAGLYRDEVPIVAQKGEFMMNRRAVNNYGKDFMRSVNNGTFNPANAGPAGVTNMNAIGGGGFGVLGAAMAAITVGSIVSRAVEATGTAMMNALSGGGDIGSINIPQKAGQYGSSFLNETQLKTAALIAEAAKEVGASKRDLTIALMTAFQESAMGTAGMYTAVDHDSLGPFQQRAAWGPAADRTDIKKSTKMFFLGGQQGQRGLFDIAGRNSMSLGAAAQAVQVSAYPSAYDKWQDEAEAIIAAGIGTLTRREVSKNLRFGDWTTAGIQKYADQWASSAIGATGPMNVQPGEYQHPVPGHPTTSGYGMRWGALHDGVDIGAPTGTPIYATKAGVVTFASNYDDGGFGLHTVVDHGGGITSGYAHQSRLGVRVGDRVAKGQNIGFVGNTGQSTGPHLHFQLGRGSSGGKYQYTTDPRAFGIPGLRVGGNVMYDNTIANLHRGETVLTKPLSESLRVGIQQLANQGIVGYDDIVELLQRDGHRLLASATEAARNAYENNTTEQQKIELNFVLQNANINGVDDLERRFREWGDDIIEKIRQEDLAKKRRLGGR